MTPEVPEENGRNPSRINRRAALRSTLAAAGAAVVATDGVPAAASPQVSTDAADARRASPKALPHEEVDQPLGVPLSRSG